MNYNFEDQDNLYDDDGNGPYDARYPGKRVVAHRGSIQVPLMMMDSAQRDVAGRYALTDSRSEAVRLRDESYALMLDRMKNPKNYDPIDGRRLVNDGIIDDLSDDEIFQLAKRLSGPMCVAVPENWSGSSHESDEDRGTERQDRDNRRYYQKPVRDRAQAVRLRDASYALMLDRLRNPKSYDLNGRRIAR